MAVLATPSASVARADDEASPAIGWTQLGLSDRLELLGANEPAEVGVPVPQGVSPTVVTGVIGPVVKAAGRVDVSDARGVVLGSIPIPPDAATVPFVLDVSAAEVLAGVAKLSFVIRDAGDGAAEVCRQPPSVTVSQLATTYSGPMPNPRTVADFLPGYLDHVTVWIGQSPTRDQQQAALVLVAELTHLYRPMPIRVDVDTSATAPAGDAVGAQRTIAIVEGDRPGLVVQNPDTPAAVLNISGKGAELLRQVDLFTDRRLGLAQSPSAVVTSSDQGPPKPTETMSFADLGVKAETSVLGVSTLFVGFDAAAFAMGPIDGAKVHLKAKYTPVTNADASLLIRSGSAILASAVLDQSGAVDLTADVPASQITSNVSLTLDVRYVPRRDCAGTFDHMTFAVDSASTVTVIPGSDNGGGFAVLPMSFTPEFDVALDETDQIRWAAQAINLLGQQTSVTLRPNVTTLDAAISRRSGLLVAANGGRLARAGLLPPLLMTSTTAVDVNGAPVTGIDLNSPVGVVEAFSSDGRMVLAIDTSGGTTLLDRSFDHIRGLNGRWGSLAGDVVATGVAGTTVELAVRHGGSAAGAAVPAGDDLAWWTWLAMAVGAVALVAVVAALLLRWRRAHLR
ncbi:MAG: hypothetical protein JWR11_1531 [Mycobacterium sp.]|nr:hypothetical protein [Mycobacterium sp.]